MGPECAFLRGGGGGFEELSRGEKLSNEKTATLYGLLVGVALG
jgi:hypothetical protein